MAFTSLSRDAGGPTRPDSQAYQGRTAQPNAESYLQGPAPAPTNAPTQTSLQGGTTSPTRYQTGPTSGSAPKTSPVMSNGLIPPQQQAAPAAQPTAAAQPAATGTNPWGPWPARTEIGYTAQPMQNYASANYVNEFVPPDLQGQAQQTALLQAVLGNPDVYNQQQQNMLQEQQKEAALTMARQQQELAMADAVGRGLTPGRSGQLAANQRRIQQGASNQILDSQRDIALQMAQANQQARLQALGMADQVLSGQAGRASQLYQTGLQGQLANQGEAARVQGMQAQQDMANDERLRFLTQMQQGAYDTDLDAFLRNRGIDTQSNIASQGFALDSQRLAEQRRQFNASNRLAQAGLLNDMFMGRSGLGLSLAQLQQLAQNNTFRTLFGG